MTAGNALETQDPIALDISIELSATGYTSEEIVGTVEPRKITISGFDLTEFGPSTELDYSGLTAMGRFLAGPGIGHLERLIRPSAPVEFSATKRVAKRKSKKKKASSVVVEVGSVCSLDSDRIMRDFGRK